MNFSELLVIFLVALIVFTPKKLPELAQTLAKVIHFLRQWQSHLKEHFNTFIQYGKLKENEEKARKVENQE